MGLYTCEYDFSSSNAKLKRLFLRETNMSIKSFHMLRPCYLNLLIVGLILIGCRQVEVPKHTTAPTVAASVTTQTCTPTRDDGVSPTYKPNTPVRTSVGHGHVLTGIVRSSRACAPIANARVELWPEYAGRGHPDEMRATVLTNSEGKYRFECDLPEHIHMRISAEGYRTIGQNSYHPNGQAEGTFDIILTPESGN